MLVLTSGCMFPTRADEDTHGLECSKVIQDFFYVGSVVRSPTRQKAAFEEMDVESQYAVYLCGNQVMHPPATHLADYFAKEGEAVVPYLKRKLAVAQGDATIRDIILVFERMSSMNTYDVADDPELMEVIETALLRMQDSPWLGICERWLIRIRQQGSIEESGA